MRLYFYTTGNTCINNCGLFMAILTVYAHFMSAEKNLTLKIMCAYIREFF